VCESVNATRTCEQCGRERVSGFWSPSDMAEDGRLYLCRECMAVMSCDGPDPDRFLWERWRARQASLGSSG
jgi:hypothetical protein